MRHLLPLLCLLAATAASLRAAPTNVLFIAVDDLRPELACYGAATKTPNLDALAASGLRFTRAYCNQAVCGASRLSLMSGLYPERTNERTYHVTGWRKRWPRVVTLNQHLGAAGFQTIGLGKIYHGTGGAGVDPDNWSQWIPVKAPATYARPENLEIIRKLPRSVTKRRGPATESAEVPDNTYADGARADCAARELARLAKTDQPWFLAVGFTKPHLPFIAPRTYWDLYERDDFRLPDNPGIPPGYPAQAANLNAGELRVYADIPKRGSPREFPAELNRRLIHGYHACVSYMDAQVGRVLRALEDSGRAGDTIVVFWADHGWKLGDHSSWCKHTNFECDTRVPLIVRHPGAPAARGDTEALVELIDIYPTLCDLLGVAKPAHLQGESFAALLADPGAKHRAAAYSSYPATGVGGKRTIGHSLRDRTHRYTEWWEIGSDRVVARVLTDLDADPGEETNLVDDPAASAAAARLSSLLKARVLAARESRQTK